MKLETILNTVVAKFRTANPTKVVIGVSIQSVINPTTQRVEATYIDIDALADIKGVYGDKFRFMIPYVEAGDGRKELADIEDMFFDISVKTT